MFSIGMQFLKAGEEYELGVGEVQGDLERTVAGAQDGSEGKPAERSFGSRCGKEV